MNTHSYEPVCSCFHLCTDISGSIGWALVQQKQLHGIKLSDLRYRSELGKSLVIHFDCVLVWMCVCISTYVNICAYLCVSICAYMHMCMCLAMYVYKHLYRYVYWMFMCICVIHGYVCMGTSKCIMYKCMYMCMCVYACGAFVHVFVWVHAHVCMCIFL